MAENATSVYLPPHLREWAQAEADADGRSLSAFIVRTLEQRRLATTTREDDPQ